MNLKALLLNNPQFFKIWLGQILSVLGDGIHQVAMLWWIKIHTGSDAMVAIVALCSTIARVVLSLIGGTYADRLDRRKLMMTVDTIRASLLVLMTVLLATDNLLPWHICVIAVLLGICSAFFTPAFNALIPQLVKSDQITTANAINHTSFAIAILFGPALGGILVAAVGTAGAIAIDASTFIFSVLMLSITPVKSAISANTNSLGQNIIDSLQFLRSNHIILSICVLTGVINFFTAPFMTFLTSFSKDVIKTDSVGFGFLWSMIPAGLAAGGILVGLFKIKKTGRRIVLQICFLGLLFIIIAIGKNFVITAISNFLIGFFASMTQVLSTTILQTGVPIEMRGRIFGFLNIITQGLRPISLALTATVIGFMSVELMLLACGLAICIFSLLGFLVPGLANITNDTNKNEEFDLA